MMNMTKTELCRKLKELNVTMDDMREVANTMPRDTVADVMVELFYTLCVETDDQTAQRALLSCLLERWWDELDEEI